MAGSSPAMTNVLRLAANGVGLARLLHVRRVRARVTRDGIVHLILQIGGFLDQSG